MVSLPSVSKTPIIGVTTSDPVQANTELRLPRSTDGRRVEISKYAV